MRPYELTGMAYAIWYDVGRILGIFQQSAVAHALCSGRMELPRNVDPLSAIQIQRIAARRGVTITAAR
jgi:hypothetical protein